MSKLLMLYIFISMLLKVWNEKERNKMFPAAMAKNIEYGCVKGKIRAKGV